MGAKSSRNTTQNNRSDGHLLEYFRNTFVRGGGGTNTTALTGLTATGGVISDYNTPPGAVYRAHIFTSSGTFSVSALATDPNIPNNVDYLVVAGGGGGGTCNNNASGGGGAGGLRSNHTDMPAPLKGSTFPVSVSPYPISVGAGGAGGVAPNANGSPGGQSVFSTITSTGGGGGGNDQNASGSSGGSGGGGGSTGGAAGSGNTPPTSPPQGNPGGAPGYGGGGGAGGAGSAGLNVSYGGNGLPLSITGITTHYAAGGSGGTTNFSRHGIGGAGDQPDTGNNATDGLFNTGSGGGGRWSPGSVSGKNGGSGIVVVRYQIAQLTATAKATGGAISYYGGKTIHTFTSTGTFTNPAPLTVDYLIVGGGGGGGYNLGGGGGGGLVHYKTSVSLPASPYPVQVGSGGAGDVTSGGTGSSGGNSVFNSVTSSGGGGGGSRPTSAGASGGSGGGASIDGAQSASNGTGDPSPSPGTANQVSPANGWGNDGGGQTAPAGAAKGGGGGGAGGVGQTGTAPPYAPGTIGLGGPGLEYTFTGSPVFYGGGGGGGATGGPNNTNQNNEYGGFGFPNNAGSPTPFPGTRGGNGYENLGGGGGGGPNNPPYEAGGNGGSGIVIIAYPS